MKKDDRAFQQAKMQFESIEELIKELHGAEAEDNEEKRENVIQQIGEDPLEVGIISQYFILLCTGGPAVRIIGELNEYNEPETARLQYQDWYTPWKEYPNTENMEEVLLDYANNFYFEGKEVGLK